LEEEEVGDVVDDDDDVDGIVLRFSVMVLSSALEKLDPVMLRVLSSSILRSTYYIKSKRRRRRNNHNNHHNISV